MIDGVPYTVVTWTSALSAVKAGDYPLNLELPVMVRMKERGQRRSGGGRNPFQDFFGDNSPFGDSPFDDSFFDDFFGGMTEKPLTLQTDGDVVKIKALPAKGRPADFSGAVGQFDVEQRSLGDERRDRRSAHVESARSPAAAISIGVNSGGLRRARIGKATSRARTSCPPIAAAPPGRKPSSSRSCR